ncbi:hypothetical protein DAI22_01g029100 [Oryza sativa Japonica Group]|nr:hypothetical protein DAI22_01g029100 [Oryza sativa Japonica Group]
MAFDCNIIQLRLDGCSQVSREGWWDWPLILLAGQGRALPHVCFTTAGCAVVVVERLHQW